MRNKLFKSTLLLSLFSFSITLANTYEEDTFLNNTRISIEFGFGPPTEWFIDQDKMAREEMKRGKFNNMPTMNSKTRPNLTFSVLANHNFFDNGKVCIGPEIGLGYGFARKLEIKNYELSIEENYLQIPLYLRITLPNSKKYIMKGILASGKNFTLGYDLNIIFSSGYKQSGSYAKLATDFRGNKNLKKAIKDFSRFSGSIVLGSGLEFPKGIYFSAKLKIADELFKSLFLTEKDKKVDNKLDMRFLNIARFLSKAIFEFSIGVDIMKLINEVPQPDTEVFLPYQAKR